MLKVLIEPTFHFRLIGYRLRRNNQLEQAAKIYRTKWKPTQSQDNKVAFSSTAIPSQNNGGYPLSNLCGPANVLLLGLLDAGDWGGVCRRLVEGDNSHHILRTVSPLVRLLYVISVQRFWPLARSRSFELKVLWPPHNNKLCKYSISTTSKRYQVIRFSSLAQNDVILSNIRAVQAHYLTCIQKISNDILKTLFYLHSKDIK